jgi:hypothetical protein
VRKVFAKSWGFAALLVSSVPGESGGRKLCT